LLDPPPQAIDAESRSNGRICQRRTSRKNLRNVCPLAAPIAGGIILSTITVFIVVRAFFDFDLTKKVRFKQVSTLCGAGKELQSAG
jgi:hypothetical protein